MYPCNKTVSSQYLSGINSRFVEDVTRDEKPKQNFFAWLDNFWWCYNIHNFTQIAFKTMFSGVLTPDACIYSVRNLIFLSFSLSGKSEENLNFLVPKA